LIRSGNGIQKRDSIRSSEVDQVKRKKGGGDISRQPGKACKGRGELSGQTPILAEFGKSKGGKRLSRHECQTCSGYRGN